MLTPAAQGVQGFPEGAHYGVIIPFSLRFNPSARWIVFFHQAEGKIEGGIKRIILPLGYDL